MAKADRVKLIQRIQQARESLVIAYVTSTRPGLEVQMAMDSVRRIYEHLTHIGTGTKKKKLKKIDLFLHSNGGDGTVPWRLVTLIREYAEEFGVLVPHRAFSAATLTALGADSIVMHPMGMLGPTDPTVMNQFNPVDPLNPQQRIGISSEDVTAYIALIKEDAGIKHEDELVIAFNKLAEQVHPLALGNVKRFLSQSRMMAKKLMCLHMDMKAKEHLIDEIVDNLTSKLYYHGHPISRSEAREIGLSTVEDANQKLEAAMWDLYLEYERDMKMDTPFDIPGEFLAQFPNQAVGAIDITPNAQEARLVFVESEKRTDYFAIDYQLSGAKLANLSTNVMLITSKKGWRTE